MRQATGDVGAQEPGLAIGGGAVLGPISWRRLSLPAFAPPAFAAPTFSASLPPLQQPPAALHSAAPPDANAQQIDTSALPLPPPPAAARVAHASGLTYEVAILSHPRSHEYVCSTLRSVMATAAPSHTTVFRGERPPASAEPSISAAVSDGARGAAGGAMGVGVGSAACLDGAAQLGVSVEHIGPINRSRALEGYAAVVASAVAAGVSSLLVLEDDLVFERDFERSFQQLVAAVQRTMAAGAEAASAAAAQPAGGAAAGAASSGSGGAADELEEDAFMLSLYDGACCGTLHELSAQLAAKGAAARTVPLQPVLGYSWGAQVSRPFSTQR